MLTSHEFQQYREEGYLIFPALISGEPLQRYKGLLDDLVERDARFETQTALVFGDPVNVSVEGDSVAFQ